MSSFTDIFNGSPIATNPESYREFSISASTTLSWSLYNEDDGNFVSERMDVTATVGSLNLIMPPANQVSEGCPVVIRNLGAFTFTVTDNSGNTIQAIAAGEIFYIYVTDNSTVNGTWSSFQFGTGTSSADAASLAGNGLTAISTTLNTAIAPTDYNTNQTITTNFRAALANWTGGVGTFALTAAATLGSNWYFIVRNSGSGILTIDPNGAETIDGAATLAINPNETCFIICNGTAFYSVAKYNAQTINFTRLVLSVAGSSNVTLTTTQAGFDIQEYTGILTGNIDVIVPTAVSRWWVYNNTTGAFTLTVKTAAGTGIAVSQGTRQILHCDGTNVVKSVDSGTGTVTSVTAGTGLSGGTITNSGTIAIAATTVAAGSYGSSTAVPTFAVNAQGQLTAAADVSIPLAPFIDSTAIIKGSADPTKLLKIEVDGFTPATTRTLTAPNFDGTIATLAGTEAFSNKTISSSSLVDSSTTIVDEGDATKKLAFQCSNIATATTRTVTAPDASGTNVLTLASSIGANAYIKYQIGNSSTDFIFDMWFRSGNIGTGATVTVALPTTVTAVLNVVGASPYTAGGSTFAVSNFTTTTIDVTNTGPGTVNFYLRATAV